MTLITRPTFLTRLGTYFGSQMSCLQRNSCVEGKERIPLFQKDFPLKRFTLTAAFERAHLLNIQLLFHIVVAIIISSLRLCVLLPSHQTSQPSLCRCPSRSRSQLCSAGRSLRTPRSAWNTKFGSCQNTSRTVISQSCSK